MSLNYLILFTNLCLSIASAPSTTTTAEYDYGGCDADQYECSSDPGVCIPKTAVCDGKPDCGANEDEKNCPTSSSSEWNYFLKKYIRQNTMLFSLLNY